MKKKNKIFPVVCMGILWCMVCATGPVFAGVSEEYPLLTLSQVLQEIKTNEQYAHDPAALLHAEISVEKDYLKLAWLQDMIHIHDEELERYTEHYQTILQLYDKGLLPKVELLNVENRIDETRLNRNLYTEQYQRLGQSLNTMRSVSVDTLYRVTSISTMVQSFKNFDEWLGIQCMNYGVISEKDYYAENTAWQERFSAEQRALFGHMYATISHKNEQIDISVDIINRSNTLVEFQIIRFKNSIIPSTSVLDAFRTLFDMKRQYITLLYEYHSAMVEAKLHCKTLMPEGR